MRAIYTVADRRQPWIVLFSAQSLEALADCLAAQPDPSRLEVGANDGAFTRPLNDRERHELAQLVSAATDRLG